MIKFTDLLKLCVVASLILNPVVQAAPGNGNSNGNNANSGGSNGNNNNNNGGQSGAVNNGKTPGSSTGGLNGGNNGNGVGNTGPGNQGNDKPVGNAGGNANSGGSNGNNANSGGSNGNNANSGGSNGNNANSGGSNGNSGSTSNGGQSGAVNNGNTSGSSTGGLNGGNNGNGVGNTGPGNQGNDKPVGNAGGNSNSGGSNGNNSGGNNSGGHDDCITGGSTSAGTTGGTTDGGTTGGTTDGGTTGGTTDGGTTGGTTDGGTTGGTTDGGTTGGTTDGGTTDGGSTDGGSTGGESTGGESTGGETGGETGETSGGETGETSGGETSGGSAETKLKEKFKVRLLPLAFGNYDIQRTAVNLTPADERDIRNNESRLDVYEDGFLVTQMRMWDAGLGVMPQAFIENATGLAALPTAAIGLALTKGRYVKYERLAADEAELAKMKTLPLPLSKKSLDQYQVGESAYFESNGGVLFLAGAGALGAYAGGSVLAEGSFRTLVRKTGANKAIVQIVKANVKTASLYTGAVVLKLDGTKVKQLGHGFNYEFDFSRGGILTVKAFEQLVAGNVSAAQEQALTPDLTGVSRVSESKSLEVTKKRGVALGVPMVAMYNWAAGKTYGETATKTYNDRTTTDLNYGVYFKEEKGRFFHKHKKITRSFYATKAVTKDESAKVLVTNEEANYFWSYENDSASSGSLNSALSLFHKDLGLKSAFNPGVARGEKLNFVRLEANVKIPESYLKKLISDSFEGRGRAEMQRDAQTLIARYFANGDDLDLCRNDEDGSAISNCQQGLTLESMTAVSRIQATLANLKDKKDASTYTYAIALMGKELVKNQFVMNAFFAQDKSCSVNFDVKLEGRRLSRMMTQIPANKNCRR